MLVPGHRDKAGTPSLGSGLASGSGQSSSVPGVVICNLSASGGHC